MFVKIFDESHEADLEDSVNEFINTNDIDIIDIKYQVSTMYDYKEQIYCYSALIMYNKKANQK